MHKSNLENEQVMAISFATINQPHTLAASRSMINVDWVMVRNSPISVRIELSQLIEDRCLHHCVVLVSLNSTNHLHSQRSSARISMVVATLVATFVPPRCWSAHSNTRPKVPATPTLNDPETL